MGLQINCLTILLMMILTRAEQTHRIQPLKNNPGLYFERMQDVYFTETDWKVIVFINIIPLHYNASFYNATLDNIKTRCKGNQKYPELCGGLVERIYLLKEINKRIQVHYDELIDTMSEVEPIDYSIPPSPKTIKRSAPFGFIGSISKTLFGTLSDSDGQKYNQQIKELFKGQINLAKISNQEAHLVEHQLAHMSKTINDTNATINKTMKAVASTIKKWNNVNTSVWHHMFNIQAITSTTNSIETALMHYLDVFKTLTEAVRAARSGHLHPSLLSTPRLQQIIGKYLTSGRLTNSPFRFNTPGQTNYLK